MDEVTKEKEIDGKILRVTKLPATRGIRLSYKLSKVLGIGFAAGASSETTANLGSAVELMFKQLPEDEFVQLVKGLLETATYDNKPVGSNFDTLFQGKMGALMQAVIFAIETNFEDFKERFGGVIQAAVAKFSTRTKQQASASENSGPVTA